MITSTVTQRYNERLYRALSARGIVSGSHDKIDELSDIPEDITDHVVVLGYGRKGRRMVDTCEELNHPYVVVENDPSLRDDVRRECEAYVFGDAMEPYTWEKANADEARVIVSVTSSEIVSRRLLELGVDATLILRARDERTALSLLDAGATYVAVPDLLASEALIQHVRGLLDGDLTSEELRSDGIAEIDDAELQTAL